VGKCYNTPHERFLIFIVGYFLAVFLGFCSLSLVNKFSADYTTSKGLLFGAFIMETTNVVLNFLNFPLKGFITLVVFISIFYKLGLRGTSLVFAMSLYLLIKIILVVPIIVLLTLSS